MLKLRQHESGDTIIEVLIAIAIVSLVLVGAYLATNRNIAVTQDTQEHTRAEKLVESQIELLRSNNGIPAGKTCFDLTQVIPVPTTSCAYNPGGSGTATYNLNISLAANVYTVSAIWDSLAGGSTAGGKNNQSQVTLYYRAN